MELNKTKKNKFSSDSVGQFRIILADNTIPYKLVMKYCTSKVNLLLGTIEEYSSIDYSIFLNLAASEGIDLKQIKEFIKSKFDCIFISEISFIDSKSSEILKSLLDDGINVLATATYDEFTNNFKRLRDLLINASFIIMRKDDRNKYAELLAANLTPNIKYEKLESRYDKQKVDEYAESISEVSKLIYLVPKKFILQKDRKLYDKIMEIVEKDIITEGSYSFFIDTPSIKDLKPRKSKDVKKILIEYAKVSEKDLKVPSLASFLYYYADDWENSARNIREMIKEPFKKGDYYSVIKSMEMLFRISEASDDDYFYYSISLYNIGNRRRALKILEGLDEKGYFSGKWEKAKKYLEAIFDYYGFSEANKFLNSIEGATPKEGMVELYRGFIKVALGKGNIDEAEMVFLRLKDILDVSNFDCELFRLLGNLYLQKNKISLALRYYEKGYQIAILKNEKECMAKSLNNLGILSYQTMDLEKSLEYYEKSRKLSREMGDEWSFSTTTGNMVPIAIELLDFKKAKELIEELIRLRNQDLAKVGLANGYFSYSDIYLYEWNLNEAIETLTKALNMIIEKGNFLEISSYLYKLSLLKEIAGFDNGNLLQMARKLGDKYSEEYAFWEGEIEFYNGRFEKAYDNFKRALKRIEKSGNEILIQEDTVRVKFLEYVLFRKMPGKLEWEKIIGEDKKMFFILLEYISANISEDEAILRLSKLPKFYEDMGKALLKGIQGIVIKSEKELLNKLNRSVIESLSS